MYYIYSKKKKLLPTLARAPKVRAITYDPHLFKNERGGSFTPTTSSWIASPPPPPFFRLPPPTPSTTTTTTTTAPPSTSECHVSPPPTVAGFFSFSSPPSHSHSLYTLSSPLSLLDSWSAGERPTCREGRGGKEGGECA